jgi:hypothetical protein
MDSGENQTMNCHVNDALDHINQAEHGAHYIIIYPDLDTLRDLYSNYVHKRIEQNNEIVLINPFYETTDAVRQVLSEKYSHGMKYRYQQNMICLLKDFACTIKRILMNSQMSKSKS